MDTLVFRHELVSLFRVGLSSPAATANLVRALFPDTARLRMLFRPEHADACEWVGQAYAGLRPKDSDGLDAWLKVFGMDPDRTEVEAYGAMVDEVGVGDPLTYATEFPGGARRVAATYLRPDMYVFEVVCKAPGASSGTRFHFLFHDGESWCMGGPLWRLLDARKRTQAEDGDQSNVG